MEYVNCNIYYKEKEVYECFFKKSFISTIDFKYFNTSLIFGGSFFILYLLSLTQCKKTEDYWLTFLFLLVPSIISLYNFAKYLFACLKWKRQVDDYVKKLLIHKNVILTINNKGCGIQEDEEINFRFWENIIKYYVSENHIKIIDQKEDYILIPKNSIDLHVFENIKEILKNKGDISLLSNEGTLAIK